MAGNNQNKKAAMKKYLLTIYKPLLKYLLMLICIVKWDSLLISIICLCLPFFC
ncbi:hypothetical protein M080_7507 [Bacteroides fragilis str. 3397 T10]|nr:hypothetical protein M080_7507 [Bacteroides fragilis str. 3397 T10]